MAFYLVVFLAIIRQLVGIPDSVYIPMLDMLFLAPLFLMVLASISKTNTVAISGWLLCLLGYLVLHVISITTFGILRNVFTYPMQELRLIIYLVLILLSYKKYRQLQKWYFPKQPYHFTISFVLVYFTWLWLHGTYRPALMSESNYDVSLVAGYALSLLLLQSEKKKHRTNRKISWYLLIMSLSNQSRTGLLTATLSMLFNKRIALIVNASFVAILIAFLVLIDYRSISSHGLSSIDRILFLQEFFHISLTELSVWQLLFGWNFFNWTSCYTSNLLMWYADTQKASNELGCLVPANFHGLIPRVVSQFGLFGFVILILGPIRWLFVNGYILVAIYLVVGGLSQSIFYHAYAAGPLLLGIFYARQRHL